MIMKPGVRKVTLLVPVICSAGWIGAVVVYLTLAVSATTTHDAQTVRAAWTAMEVAGWWAIVPFAVAALATGLIMSLGTQWGPVPTLLDPDLACPDGALHPGPTAAHAVGERHCGHAATDRHDDRDGRRWNTRRPVPPGRWPDLPARDRGAQRV
jgi:hypothetical protein